MREVKEKTANQLYKESGSSLPFKEWIGREKEKYANADGLGLDSFILNKQLNQSVQDTLKGIQSPNVAIQDVQVSDTIFGINKYVVYGAGIIIAGAIIYKYLERRKENNRGGTLR